jgi:hypothetical protein
MYKVNGVKLITKIVDLYFLEKRYLKVNESTVIKSIVALLNG